MRMNSYYEEKLKQGLEYQDFVSEQLYQIGLPIFNYASKKYQIQRGENKLGIEIKFDDKYKTTGNLYVELAEKSKKENECFILSGINRNDNCWLYIIGDYETIYIFTKRQLKELYKINHYIEKEIPTSKGFLLPKTDAEKYAAKIIKLNKE